MLHVEFQQSHVTWLAGNSALQRVSAIIQLKFDGSSLLQYNTKFDKANKGVSLSH